MAIRKIPPRDFVEFVIENGFKDLPELVDKYPVEIIRERLNRNIENVFESRDDSVIYSAYYCKDNDSVCIVNTEKRFNLDLLKQEEDKYHSAIHESIHALISKRYIKKTKKAKHIILDKIKGYLKAKTFYCGMFLRKIDEKHNLPIRAYGIAKTDKCAPIRRNIAGFFEGDRKFKYKGSLISKFFYMKKSLFYLSNQKAIGLEEGFTEWLTRKIVPYGNSYKNVVCIINQMEAILGTRKTMDIADGKLSKIRKMINMDSSHFYDMLYRMDEIVRAEYRRDTFEKKLEFLEKSKKEKNEEQPKSIVDLVKQKLDIIGEDLQHFDSDKKSNVEITRKYYKSIIQENLMRTEEILIDQFLIRNLYEALNKQNIELVDVKQSVKIFEQIRMFALNSDVSQSKFLKSNCYKRFQKVFQEIGKRFLVEYKDKLKDFSSEELEYAYEIYDYFESRDKNLEFFEKLEECKNKNFYENIMPEIESKFKKGAPISFQDISSFINNKGVLLNNKAFWEYILGRKLKEEEVYNLNIEKDLYINFGVKFNKENLVKDPYSEKYDIVVEDRYIGKIRKEYADIFFKDGANFSDDRFFYDGSLNIEGLLTYKEYLLFQKEKQVICAGNEDLADLVDHGEISLGEAEQIQNGTYTKFPKEKEEKPKTSFKNIIEKILRKKSINVLDVEDYSLKKDDRER